MSLARAEAASRALTALESGPLKSADAVLYGSITNVRDIGVGTGRQLVAIRLLEVFKQHWSAQSHRQLALGDIVHIVVRGPRGVLGSREAAPAHFQLEERGKCAFFLSRGANAALVLQRAIRETGNSGADKIDAIRTIARLSKTSDRLTRETKILNYLLARAAGRGRWNRVNATRELHHVATIAPELFDRTARRRVNALSRRTLTPDQQQWLQELERAIGPYGDEDDEDPLPEDTTPATRLDLRLETWLQLFGDASTDTEREGLFSQLLAAINPSKPEPKKYEALLAAFGRSSEGLQRWVLDRLVYNGCEHAVPRLRAHYAHTVDVGTRHGLVRTVGLLGKDRDVPWLRDRMNNRTLRRAALLSLARIRSKRALAVLQGELKTQSALKGAAARGEAQWIRYLLTRDFIRVDATRAR